MAQRPLILNRYRPIFTAGVGGFGTVQVAWDTRIQRKVALKCIELNEADAWRAQYSESAAYQGVDFANDMTSSANEQSCEVPQEYVSQEFVPEHSLAHIPGLDEARTAAMLTDPNIVAVYDFEVQGRTAYLIMEYIEGITLTELLHAHKDQITIDMIAALFNSVAHALTIAHDNQVLHLDVKPDNVLINRQGQVKVTDFGLATLADAGGFATAGGGTIGYMPLEQMRQENLDARCDEWALASLAYEMLTGQNPFLASDLKSAERAIEDAELVLPSLCWDGIDEGIDDVVFLALDPDCEERYDSVADFAHALTPYLGDAQRGCQELAVLVGGARDEASCATEEKRIPLIERLGRRSILAVSRALALAGSLLLASLALMNVEQVGGFSALPFWGLIALVAIAALIKPHVGALLAYGMLALALIMNGVYLIGTLLLVAVALWWFLLGRKGDAQADVALVLPLAGAVGGATLTPIAVSCFLSVKQTCGTILFSLFTAVVLASFGSLDLAGWNAGAYWSFALSAADIENRAIALLMRVDVWCMAGGWFMSALAASAFYQHGTKLWDIVGAIVCGIILLASVGVGTWLTSGMTSYIPTLAVLIPTLIAAILGVVAAIVGIPDRARWDGTA